MIRVDAPYISMYSSICLYGIRIVFPIKWNALQSWYVLIMVSVYVDGLWGRGRDRRCGLRARIPPGVHKEVAADEEHVSRVQIDGLEPEGEGFVNRGGGRICCHLKKLPLGPNQTNYFIIQKKQKTFLFVVLYLCIYLQRDVIGSCPLFALSNCTDSLICLFCYKNWMNAVSASYSLSHHSFACVTLSLPRLSNRPSCWNCHNTRSRNWVHSW